MTAASQPARSPDPEAAARIARERSSLYGFLAAVFRNEPTSALISRIRDHQFHRILKAAGVQLGEDFARPPENELLQDLAAEYTQLFLGPGSHVQPYAAVYLGGEGASLCGPATTWAHEFMERAGFQIAPGHRSLPDHVSVELEFMARMAEREARAFEESDLDMVAEYRSVQRTFLESHLVRWLPDFCGRAVERAQLTFYREMARLAAGFVESEIRSFAEPEEIF